MIEKQHLPQLGNKFEARQLLKTFQKRVVIGATAQPVPVPEPRVSNNVADLRSGDAAAKPAPTTVTAALERAAVLIETFGARIQELEENIQSLESQNADLADGLSDLSQEIQDVHEMSRTTIVRAEAAEIEAADLKRKINQLTVHPVSESAQLVRLIKAVDACLAAANDPTETERVA